MKGWKALRGNRMFIIRQINHTYIFNWQSHKKSVLWLVKLPDDLETDLIFLLRQEAARSEHWTGPIAKQTRRKAVSLYKIKNIKISL